MLSLRSLVVITLLSFAGLSCSRPSHAESPESFPDAPVDLEYAEDAGDQTAILAGGCFWCTEAVFERLEGVKDVASGYAGGTPETADYKQVSRGNTQHAEVIRIVYDPKQITYGQLLKVFFSVAHDPTQLNRQGNDVGPQYRSAVFYQTDAEKEAVEKYIALLDEQDTFGQRVVTTVEPLEAFHLAENYHQDYARLNPDQPYIRFVSTPKVEKLVEKYPEKLKDSE